MALMDRLLRIGEGKILKQLKGIANQVNSIEDDFVAMSDEELRGQTADFKSRYEKGETLESLLPEAFATVREASKRVLDKRHFDVQVMGGAALHLGNIAEMKTGEGKTLVATCPSYLNAISGRGVHVVTVNDYLAKLHSEQMGRIHHFLGLEVGAILSQMDPAERRKAYHADITYGTNNEFGFDYLRDNMALSLEDCVQREYHFAIVDEVDSILIDEARTPLIISGPAEDSPQVVSGVRQAGRPAQPRRSLRGRREEADRRDLGERHRRRRGPARHRQPVRVGEHPADLLPEQRDQGQGAVQARPRLRDHRRRDADRRRAHRPDADRPPLQRGPAPGDRGQGAGGDPRRVPDARHDHPAELLPDVREALRDDRHRDDRGQRVPEDLRPRRGADPDQHADDPRRPAGLHLPHRGGEVRRDRRGRRRAARERPAGADRHRIGGQVGDLVQAAQAGRASSTRC